MSTINYSALANTSQDLLDLARRKLEQAKACEGEERAKLEKEAAELIASARRLALFTIESTAASR
jgi:hypothetical protein